MSAEQITSLVRRKVQSGRDSYAARAVSLARAIRLTAPRQADKLMDLALNVIGITQAVQSGATLREALAEDALLLLLEGKGGCAGLVAISPTVVDGLIQQQTMGRIRARPEGEAVRKPTATDAALCAPFVENLLRHAAELPEAPSERAIIAGYRFGVHAEDPREACLSLDANEYQHLSLTLDLAAGTCSGTLDIFLPPPPPPERPGGKEDDTPETPETGSTLSDTVMDLHADLTIALTQIELPIRNVTRWAVGDVVELSVSSMDQATVLDANGRAISRGILGQLDGVRAVQLEQKSKPHIHPRRRASDRAELEQPDILESPPKSQESPTRISAARDAPLDVFGGDDEMLDMSDLDLDLPDAPASDEDDEPDAAFGDMKQKQAV